MRITIGTWFFIIRRKPGIQFITVVTILTIFLVINEELATQSLLWSSTSEWSSKELNPWHITYPNKYLINEPDLCSTMHTLTIINVVGVGPGEVTARTRIRKLWGNTTWVNMTGFKTVFMVGTSEEPQLMADLRRESQQHRDIIQVDFMDSYQNLTLKTLSSLKWVVDHCPQAPWFLKSDSDVLVNIFRLPKYLKIYDSQTRKRRGQLLCRKRWLYAVEPCRDCVNVKWRVSWWEYSRSKYPEYCKGPGCVIPRKLVEELNNAAQGRKPFRMEDVYYTGILPESLGWIRWIHDIYPHFPYRPKEYHDKLLNALMILEPEKKLGKEGVEFLWAKIREAYGADKWLERRKRMASPQSPKTIQHIAPKPHPTQTNTTVK